MEGGGGREVLGGMVERLGEGEKLSFTFFIYD